jgi:protein involved in polysaccharide export with SLBB domain
VYIWGSVYDEISSTIDHEGNFLIPAVGLVAIKGLTLKEGKDKIREKILKVYTSVEMSIILSKVRDFKVYVLGEVVYPGFYIVNGATRVSDLVVLAGGWKQPKLEKELDEQEEKVNLRRIEIRNESSPVRFADLALFYHGNSTERNPYLIEGDRVYVSKRKDYISVFGAVNYPGEYDYAPGDSLLTAIAIAGGLSREADSTKIIVSRFVNDADSLVSFELSMENGSISGFTIEKDDRVLVCEIPEYRLHREVLIQGEVRFPGVYPIRDDKTKLADVIAMAGGLTDKAFLRASKIVRKEYYKIGDREFNRLKNIPVQNLSPLERSYLKTKQVEEEGNVSIDFEELLKNGSDLYNIILRDGDEITIAQKNLTIKVTGAVVSPGLIGFKDGANYKYYVNQAGGFNTRARKHSVIIIKGGTEIWLKPRKVDKIEAGDAVWVPEEQYRDRLQTTKDVLLILGSIATILISIITIKDYFD